MYWLFFISLSLFIKFCSFIPQYFEKGDIALIQYYLRINNFIHFNLYTMKQLLFCLGLTLSQQLTLLGQNLFQSTAIEGSYGSIIKYRVLEPINKKPDVKYPVVIFLHGSGERGDDNTKQLVHGAALFENDTVRNTYPAYIVFPQCPQDDFWANKSNQTDPDNPMTFDYSKPLTKSLSEVFEIIEYYRKAPFIDSNRVYIMGLSMGGMGTLEAISRFPDLFAAAIPICGGGDKRYYSNFAQKVPVWAFHGAKDDVVLPKYSRELVAEIKQHGGNPKYTEFKEANHNSWDPAFATKDLLKWLFEQKKSSETK